MRLSVADHAPPLIYGIYREKALSPGKVEADAAILEAVLSGLRAVGCEVATLAAEDLPALPPPAHGFVHLAQGPAALTRLLAWEAHGARLINPPQAVRRCWRRFLPEILAAAGVPYPRTRLYTLEEAESLFPRAFPGPGWLKRAEIHAEGPGDVVRVATPEEARAVLRDFRRRGIGALVWQEHLPGREVKFYGVGPGRFFWAAMPEDPEPLPLQTAAPLAELAARAAAAVGLSVFGGDLILTATGPVLIDLNDWPSFSRCREAAAREIVHYVCDAFHLGS
jgi:glutathione synthase/RimK-type ligase-like ATP-grasp enzyme